MFTKNVLTSSIQGAGFELEYLVIAGGGGGGGSDISLPTSGGGAGGYRSAVAGEDSGGGASAESPLVANLGVAYTITVGSGGSGGAAIRAGNGSQGSSSVFSTITSVGGGYGAAYDNDGGSGGSGGGAGGSAAGAGKVAGTGTSGQGFDGGLGFESNTDDQQAGGGGGGAGQAGQDAVSDVGGNGGDGVSSVITGSNTYRAGGGGGGDRDGGTYGSGGLGGGGDATSTNGSAGTVNTGGGGGAGSNGTGGNGGSGVVIIKLPRKIIAEFSAGVSYNYIPVDGFHVYEITAAGVSDTVTFSDGSDTPVTIDESLRFNDDDNAYLSRTPASAGNRQKFTWSGWVKRSNLNGSGGIMQLFDVNTGGVNECGIRFSSDAINAYDYTGSYQWRKAAYNLLRDPSSWYHIHLEFDSTRTEASQRAKLYVNGVEVDYQYSVDPALNYQGAINTANPHYLGKWTGGSTRNFDGYMADIYFIDGQALDPSNFGHADDNGVWQPIAYPGTYGTNGFHLEFADNSTAAALGTDTSGNGNDWTPSGITTDDQVTDTPTVNYATLNSIDKDNNATLSEGNLKVASNGAGNSPATFLLTSGKWYWEAQGTGYAVGVAGEDGKNYTGSISGTGSKSIGYWEAGGVYWDGGSSTGLATYTASDVVACALDMDAGTVAFYKNNTLIYTATFGSGTVPDLSAGVFPVHNNGNTTSRTVVYNFGQQPFTYTPPTGFVALSSTNLPTPTIADGKEHFDIALYTGDGGSQNVRGFEFQPDFVWVKERTTTEWHQLYDALRGTGALFSNDTSTELTLSGISFLSNGFTASDTFRTNQRGLTYVGWAWNAGGSTVTNTDGTITSQVRANTTAGFSIVSYTGNGSASQTIGHGLGQDIDMVIVKNRDDTDNWRVWHSGLSGDTYYVGLNQTFGEFSSSTVFNGHSSTTFTVGTDPATNGNTEALIAYCFASVEGFSKFGTYTGNGSADGPFIYTGFRPALVIKKAVSVNGEQWPIMDSKRLGYNVINNYLQASSTAAEFSYGGGGSDILSNGFKLRSTSTGLNGSGITFIYMAFAENPFKTARAR